MTLNRIIDIATMALVWIGGALILGVMFVTIGDIIARWGFSKGYIGLVDVTQFAVVGFAYLSLPRVFWTDANVAIELYDDHLSVRLDALLRLFAGLLALGALGILLWYGWTQASRTLRFGDVSQNVEIPMIAFWGLILSGLAASAIVVILRLVQAVLQLMRGEAQHVD